MHPWIGSKAHEHRTLQAAELTVNGKKSAFANVKYFSEFLTLGVVSMVGGKDVPNSFLGIFAKRHGDGYYL
jgi:hypothetical protein